MLQLQEECYDLILSLFPQVLFLRLARFNNGGVPLGLAFCAVFLGCIPGILRPDGECVALTKGSVHFFSRGDHP